MRAYLLKRYRKMSLRDLVEARLNGNYFTGANIAGFVKVVNAMLDQGIV